MQVTAALSTPTPPTCPPPGTGVSVTSFKSISVPATCTSRWVRPAPPARCQQLYNLSMHLRCCWDEAGCCAASLMKSPLPPHPKQNVLSSVTSGNSPGNITITPISDADNNTATIKIVSVLTNRDQVKCSCARKKLVCHCVPGALGHEGTPRA